MVAVELQAGRDGGREDRAVHPVRAARTEVAGDLASAHREADQGHVVQVELGQHGVEVAGQGVVVVAARSSPGLSLLAEAPAVVGDHPVAGSGEGRHLVRTTTRRSAASRGQDHGAAVAAAVLDVEGDGPLRIVDIVGLSGRRGWSTHPRHRLRAPNQRMVHSIPVVYPSRW